MLSARKGVRELGTGTPFEIEKEQLRQAGPRVWGR